MVENVNLIKEILKEFDLDFTDSYKQRSECINTQSLETRSFSTQVQDDEEYFTLEHPNDSFADIRCLNKQEFLDANDGLMDTSDYVRYLLEQTDSIVKANKDLPDNIPKVKSPEVKDAKTGPDLGIMDWNNYHRLEVIYNFMDDLEAMFPSTCTVFVIGQSLEKRDLKILKISNSVASNASVWMDAGIHAREWIAPAVATYVADHIANHFDTLPDYITNKDWYFLPVVNPDGYEYTHTNERLWRKNMAKIKHQYYGVDLNRNFSFGWGGRGSSDNPTHSFYRGTEPFSEPESSAVRDMILNCEIPFKVYITLHSFGQVIIFPLACSDEICPDYIRLLEGATVMSKESFKVASNNSRTQVWEVKLIREGQRQFIKGLDTIGAVNIWKEERSTMDIMVEGLRSGQVAGMLHEREIPYAIAINDVTNLLEKEISTLSSISLKQKRIMDWNDYYRLDEIYAFMENLAEEYPYLCSVVVIGKSYEGRLLQILRISNGDQNNVGVWLDGSIHPREWISTAVVTYIADKLVRTFHEQPDSVTNKDWYILPVFNPDGYEYTHTHDRMWRKNRARYGDCIGVDLNRNFSYGWGEKGEEGSSDDPGNIFYRGPKPFSEPETSAVKRYITKSGVDFKAFLSLHSYGEVIIFPWGYTGDACPDYVELLEGGTAIAKAIFQTSGHTYKVGSTKDLMYFAAGTSVDWSYGFANIPYSYMIELRGKTHRFLLPKEDIIVTANEVFSGVLRLMDFIDKRKDLEQE